jgi:adenosylcobinamide-GDP ribazoletransferase
VLEIMKDSRVGSYGAIALILAFLTKFAALTSLARADVVAALIAAHTLSRWSSVVLLQRYSYVGTKGVAFAGTVKSEYLGIASIAAFALTAVALRHRAVIVLLAVVLASVVVTFTAGTYFRRRLDGVTGDCLGAANQLVEIAVYLVVSAHHISMPG